MAKRKISISKEWLQSLGITHVTEDGRIFNKKGELKQYTVKAIHKYGEDRCYPVVSIYDPKLHEKQKSKGKAAPGNRMLLVSRVVFAWFNGVCPDDYDVDHIDDNQFNNSISNLQLLTRTDNLRKRGPGKNRWTVNFTREQLEYYQQQSAGYKEQIERHRESVKEFKEKLDKLTLDFEYHRAVCLKIGELGILNKLKEEYEDEKAELVDTINRFKRDWHYWCRKYNDFKKTYLKDEKGENK